MNITSQKRGSAPIGPWPTWARYAAQNDNGNWHYYEFVPFRGRFSWIRLYGKTEYAGWTDPPTFLMPIVKNSSHPYFAQREKR